MVRDFFAEIERVPDWFEPAATRAGCAGFHANSEMFIGAFVGAVRSAGLATLISKFFAIIGRVLDQPVRRLQQNNAHLLKIFLPQGMARENDGWKLSVRIRLIHASVLAFLNHSDESDQAAWGVPLSAAHIGFATAAFSGLLLTRARQLGVHLSPAETQSFMMIWRYSGQHMGLEPELLAPFWWVRASRRPGASWLTISAESPAR